MGAKAGLLHLTKDKPCNNLAYIESSVSVVALCAVRKENEGFGPARRGLTNSIMQWQMVQNSGHISLPILSGSMVQTLGANSSKTWACHASPAANSKQDLVKKMRCRFGRSI